MAEVDLATALAGCDEDRHSSWAERTQAALARLASRGLTSRTALLAALASLEPELLCDAVYVLGRLAQRDDVEALVELWGPAQSQAVKHEIIDAVAEIGGPRAVAALTAWVDDATQEPKLRWVACNQLSFCAGANVATFEVLLRVAASADEDLLLRGQALEALCSYVEEEDDDGDEANERWERAVALFEACLTDESGELRFWAIYGLGQLGAERALPALERLVETDDFVASFGWENREEARDVVHYLRTGEWLEPDAHARAVIARSRDESNE